MLALAQPTSTGGSTQSQKGQCTPQQSNIRGGGQAVHVQGHHLSVGLVVGSVIDYALAYLQPQVALGWHTVCSGMGEASPGGGYAFGCLSVSLGRVWDLAVPKTGHTKPAVSFSVVEAGKAAASWGSGDCREHFHTHCTTASLTSKL